MIRGRPSRRFDFKKESRCGYPGLKRDISARAELSRRLAVSLSRARFRKAPTPPCGGARVGGARERSRWSAW